MLFLIRPLWAVFLGVWIKFDLRSIRRHAMQNKDKIAITELENQFKHYDIDHQVKDRLIWQYLINRKMKREMDIQQNEVDTDWEN